jgi:hypothetical protein
MFQEHRPGHSQPLIRLQASNHAAFMKLSCTRNEQERGDDQHSAIADLATRVAPAFACIKHACLILSLNEPVLLAHSYILQGKRMSPGKACPS